MTRNAQPAREAIMGNPFPDTGTMETACLSLSVGAAADTEGRAFRLRALRRALAHIVESRDDLWITTPGSVAMHFEKAVPAPAWPM